MKKLQYLNHFAVIYAFLFASYCWSHVSGSQKCENTLLWPSARSGELSSFTQKLISAEDKAWASKLNSENREDRESAILHFSSLPQFRAELVPIFESILSDSSEITSIRNIALDALVVWRSKESASIIEAQLHSQEISLRRAAIQGLARLGLTKYLTTFKAFLKDAHPAIRYASVEALRILEDKSCVPDLEVLLDDTDSNVQFITLKALTDLQANQKSTVTKINSFLKSENKLLRFSAIKALGKLGNSESISLLQALLEKNAPNAGEVAISLAMLGDVSSVSKIESLAKLEDDNSSHAIKALGLLKSKASIPLLEKIFLENSEYSIRNAAADVLAYSFGDIRYHHLYRDLNNASAFFDKNSGDIPIHKFTKTGSTTLLLGGKLAGKVILRIFPQKQFNLWSNALQKLQIWKNAGFDYVPIEPILNRDKVVKDYKLGKEEIESLDDLINSVEEQNADKNNFVVLAKVLGPPLASFEEVVDAKQHLSLRKKTKKILETLQWDIGIKHDDAHDNNFCIKADHGKVQIFLIDFDQIKSFF